MSAVLLQAILQGVDTTLLKSLDVCSGDALWLMSPSLGTAPLATANTAAEAVAVEAVAPRTSASITAKASPAGAGERGSEAAAAALQEDPVRPASFLKCTTRVCF